MAAEQAKRRGRGAVRVRLRRAAFGAAIALVGFAAGLVAGSVLEGPRLLIEWLRGPVRSVEVAAVRSEAEPVETGSLREVSDLHRPAARRRPAAEPRPSSKPAPPPPAGPPPAAAARPAPPPVPARAPTPPAAPAASPAGTPVVQVAATTDPAEAGRIVARLRAGGFDAFSVTGRPGGTTTHRVRVRAPRGEEPSALAERLREQGFDTWITRD